MTLLHQAAQKAVEAIDELLYSSSTDVARSKAATALAAIESALQHQEVPREPVARNALLAAWRAPEPVYFEFDKKKPKPDGFAAYTVLQLHRAFADGVDAASPSTTRQQEVGSAAARDVLAERARQISAEGWTAEHDDEHGDGQLAFAAACYAQHASARAWMFGNLDDAAERYAADDSPDDWPDSWDTSWWRPKNPRRDLVRAAALILAEIERMDRAAAPSTPEKAGGEKACAACKWPLSPCTCPAGVGAVALTITEGELWALIHKDFPFANDRWEKLLTFGQIKVVVERALAHGVPAVAPAQPLPGVETLRNVIECLRADARYVDEEGEATDQLQDLLDALRTPGVPASGQTKENNRG